MRRSYISDNRTLLQLFAQTSEENKKNVLVYYKEWKGERKGKENDLFTIFLKELVRKQFKWFVKLFIPLIENQEFDFALHCEILCELCQQHSQNNLKYDNDVVVNIPPGHSKTLICNVLYTSWLLGKEPAMRIIVRTTSDRMASSSNLQCGAIINSQAFKEVFGSIATSTTSNVIKTKGKSSEGFRESVAIGSRVTGESCEFLLLDDANNCDGFVAKETATYESVINQYEGALSTRQRGTDISLQTLEVQQRVSNFDLSGHILKVAKETNRPVNHIIIRAWEDEDKEFVIECKDYNRTFIRPKGYLWYPKSEKMRNNRLNLYERMRLNHYIWASQYQQDPRDTGLSLIPITYFQWYKEEVEDLPIYATFITCDIAFAENETSDRTCICCWGLARNGDIYLIDILFDRMPVEKIPDIFIKFYERNMVRRFRRKTYENDTWEDVWCFAFYIESVHNEMVIPYFRTKINCVRELERKANSTKWIRLNKALPVIALKIVHLPLNRFYNEVQLIKEELREITTETFTRVHDDFCDNLVDSINEGRQSGYNAISILAKLNSLQ